MTGDQYTESAACAATSGGVPGCGTGPVGRMAFVARELADLWRELRGATTGHVRSTSDLHSDKDTDT